MARFRLCSGGRVNKICRTGLRVGRERKETFMIPRIVTWPAGWRLVSLK